jgi:PAS domain S-box-containing protein
MPAPDPHRPTSIFASLRARLLALALCCLLPALVVVAILGVVQHRYEREEARRDALHLTSVVSASQLHQVVAGRNFLESLASQPEILGPHPECSRYLAEILRLNPAYSNLGVASASGDVVASAVPLPHPVRDADREWFRRAVATREFAYGSYVVSRVLDKPTLNFACPLLARDGTLKGVLFASMGLSWFEEMEDRFEIPEGSTLAILDNEGVVIDTSPRRPSWFRSAAFEKATVDAIRRHHGGATESSSLDGVKRLWALSPLFDPTTPGGYIAIGIPVSSAFAQSIGGTVLAIAALLFISGLGLAVAWLGSSLLVIRKVRRLVETSKLLAAGNLDARSGLSEDQGELGQLGSSLDEMATALGRREREIRLAERSMAEVERRLTVQQAVTKALADSSTMSEAISPILASIGQGFGWDVGILWQVDVDSDTLRCAGTWSAPQVDAGQLLGQSLATRIHRGESGPGRVWQVGKAYAGGIASGPVDRIEAAALAGLHSTLAFPVPGGTEIVGVLELFSRSARMEEGPAESLSVLAQLLGESMVRRQGETTQARLLGILERTSDLVGFASPDGRILYTNRAGRKMLGVGQEEDITASRIADYYDEKNGRVMAEVVIPTAIQAGSWVGEVVMRSREGKPVQVSAVIMVHRPSDGEVEYISIIARDITEKVRLEEQLRQAQKMEAVGSLAGGIAHDFNNLLTAIQGFSDLALTRLGDPEALKRDLEEVRRASVRAAALTRQLLIFSRQQVLQPQPVSVNLLVTELGKMLRRLIGEDIDLTMTCQEPASMILADPGQIEQVIINLVVNARDAMPEGGRIVVETSRAEIDASDAGIRPGV